MVRCGYMQTSLRAKRPLEDYPIDASVERIDRCDPKFFLQFSRLQPIISPTRGRQIKDILFKKKISQHPLPLLAMATAGVQTDSRRPQLSSPHCLVVASIGLPVW